jgi:HD-GYP domain-containing protein (c-di-GMP phosphodiesterase class II)
MEAMSPNTSVVILAFKNEVISDVYALALEEVLGSQVISCSDAAAASLALRKHPDACVVIDSNISSVSIAAFFQKQSVLAKRANVFVLGGSASLIPPNLGQIRVDFLPAMPEMKEVVSKIEKALHLEASSQHFCKIALKSLLIRSDKLRCDVYLKLGDEKFVKVMHANDRFDLDEYKRFQQKNVTFLYLARTDFLGLMDDLLEKVAVLNRAPDEITIDAAMKTNTAIFETVHAAFETEGFTPDLQKLTEASVRLAINTINKNPKLSELLTRIDENRDSFIGWHSTALSFLCCKLATMLGWHSEATFYKLSLASILHDLSLTSHSLAKINNLEQLNAANLSEKDKDIVLRHPTESGMLVNGFDDIPGEVGFIVEQHHERQDGAGFPRGVDHKEISAISALFIIAHDIVTTMFESPTKNFQLADFLTVREAQQIYTKGHFGHVFRSLVAQSNEA